MRFKSRNRALAAAALSATVGLAGLTLAASPAQATEPTDVVRVAGTTRYGTAAEAATMAYPDGAANVVLASGEKFPDALAGGGLAGSLDAPILLAQLNAIPAETQAALAELDPETITILGGTEAISAAVEAGLEAAGFTVNRVGGEDRFETASLIAEELGGDTAVLANGLNFPDALAISPGTHKLGLPLLLTTANALQADAAAFIGDDTVENVIIVGGTAVVSQATEDALEADGKTVTRLAGATRYETSVEIAEFHVTQGFTLDELVLATGEEFPDALAGGPFASQMNAPMVLTQTATLTPATGAFITTNCEAIDTLDILGGTAAVTATVEAAAAAAAQCGDDGEPGEPTPDMDFDVTQGAEAQLLNPGSDGIAIFEYTFSGLPETVDVALVPCYYVEVADNGDVVFADDPDPFDATFDPDQDNNSVRENGAVGGAQDTLGTTITGNSFFIFANGELDRSAGSTYLDDVPTEDGELVLEVFNGGPDCFIPLVFDDTAVDDTLVLDANDRTTTPFAVGGAGVPSFGEAPSGQEIDGEVIYIDQEEDFFVAVDDASDMPFQYFYGDSGDTYAYEGGAQLIADEDFRITLEEFEEYLSVGDSVSAGEVDDFSEYSRTAENSFRIEYDLPNSPTNATATVGDFDDDPNDSARNDVLITWEAPEPTEGFIIDYEIDRYRQQADGTWTYDGTLLDSDEDEETPPANPDLNNDNIDDNVDLQTVDEEVGQGTFKYVVTAVSGSGDVGLFSSNPTAAVSPEAVAGAPRSVSATVTDANGVLNSGDTITLVFDQVMEDPNEVSSTGPGADGITGTADDPTAPSDTDVETITLTDADGTIVQLRNGAGATFTLVAPNTIRVTLTSDPVLITAGTTATPALPMTIVGASGVEDADQDVNWDVANSPDRALG